MKRYDNYGRYSVYLAFLQFSLMIASPFFAVYMLKDLGFSYVTFMAVAMSGSVFYLLFSPLAGKFSDRFGNVKLLYIANALFVLTPIAWVFITSPILLILIPQLIAGIATAAYVIGTTNFTYSAVSPQKRAVVVPYLHLLIGFGIFFGSLLGGLLFNNLNITFLKPILFVFLTAATARFLVGLIFLPRIKDENRIEQLPPMHISFAHPFRTLQTEVGWFKSIFR